MRAKTVSYPCRQGFTQSGQVAMQGLPYSRKRETINMTGFTKLLIRQLKIVKSNQKFFASFLLEFNVVSLFKGAIGATY